MPFGPSSDPDGAKVNVLYPLSRPAVCAGLLLAGLLGVVTAAAMRRAQRWGRVGRRVLVGVGAVYAVVYLLVIPDYRILLAVVRAPMLLAGAPFGFPRQMSLADFLPAFLPWTVVVLMLIAVGGTLWGGATIVFVRRCRSSCVWCGRGDRPERWTGPAQAARWGRTAVWVAVAVPLFYCATRWAFALGIPLGVTRQTLEDEAAENPGIWIAGAMLATMGGVGSLLTVGLIRPWGEVWPRWVPRLRGKPVRPRAAIIPASIVSILIAQVSVMSYRAAMAGDLPAPVFGPDWGLELPGALFIVWSAALATATLGYHLRRRGSCPHCRRPLTNTLAAGAAASS